MGLTVNINKNEMMRRGLKYIIQWLSLVIALKIIPIGQIGTKKILMVAIIGAVTFALLDIYSPAISNPVQ